MQQRILLTGASGFVGTYVRAALAQRRPDASLVGTAAGPGPKAGDGLVALDLLDRAGVDATVAATKPDVVIHLAGQSSVATGESAGGDLTWPINVGGAIHLATAVARHAPEATILVASSAEVYGGSFLGGPVSEASALLPMNAYAKSKASAERVFADILPSTARLILARPFNHTGAGQREDFVLPSFAGQVARIEAGLQPPRLAVGNLSAARDFLNVRDVVDAYLALLAAAETLPGRFVVNIASGRTRVLGDLLESLRSMATVPFEIAVDPARLRRVDVPVACGDAALMRAVTGWSPRIEIEATLLELLEAARAGLREAR